MIDTVGKSLVYRCYNYRVEFSLNLSVVMNYLRPIPLGFISQ